MLPVLGDIFNPSDNIMNMFDMALINFTVTVPDNSSGNSFNVSATLTFSNVEQEVPLTVFTQTLVIVLPAIMVDTDVSET